MIQAHADFLTVNRHEPRGSARECEALRSIREVSCMCRECSVAIASTCGTARMCWRRIRIHPGSARPVAVSYLRTSGSLPPSLVDAGENLNDAVEREVLVCVSIMRECSCLQIWGMIHGYEVLSHHAGICNCSIHRLRQGLAPTGSLYRQAVAAGKVHLVFLLLLQEDAIALTS